jgi:hypothetical protein
MTRDAKLSCLHFKTLLKEFRSSHTQVEEIVTHHESDIDHDPLEETRDPGQDLESIGTEAGKEIDITRGTDIMMTDIMTRKGITGGIEAYSSSTFETSSLDSIGFCFSIDFQKLL